MLLKAIPIFAGCLVILFLWSMEEPTYVLTEFASKQGDRVVFTTTNLGSYENAREKYVVGWPFAWGQMYAPELSRVTKGRYWALHHLPIARSVGVSTLINVVIMTTVAALSTLSLLHFTSRGRFSIKIALGIVAISALHICFLVRDVRIELANYQPTEIYCCSSLCIPFSSDVGTGGEGSGGSVCYAPRATVAWLG